MTKSDKEMQTIYANLYRYESRTEEDIIWYYENDAPIFRVVKNRITSHISRWEKKFLISDDEQYIELPKNISFIKGEIYLIPQTGDNNKISEQDKQLAKDARHFLEYCDVEEFTAQEQLLIQLKEPPTEDEAYFNFIRELIRFKETKNIPFHKYEFIWADNNWGISVVSPKNIYMKTYRGIDFDALKKEGLLPKDCVKLSSRYKQELSPDEYKQFINFMEKIGFFSHLEISRGYASRNDLFSTKLQVSGNWTYLGTNRDFNIDDLRKYLTAELFQASLLVWQTVINADSEVTEAVYSPNNSAETRRCDSMLVQQLRKHQWIPDKSGNFQPPEDITQETLHADFPYKNDNSLLTAIGFGDNAVKQTEKQKEKDKQAKSLGFSNLEEAEKFKKIQSLYEKDGKSIDDVLGDLENKKYHTCPILLKNPSLTLTEEDKNKQIKLIKHQRKKRL